MTFNWLKGWWATNVAAALIGIGAILLADQFFESLSDAAVFFFLALLGASFLWVFWRNGIAWAVAPGVSLLTLALAILASVLVGENNGWVATLMLGLAAFVIAAIPNPSEEIKGVYIVGSMLLVIGFLLAPVAVAWKIVLCVASVLIGAFLLWRNRSKLGVSIST